MWDIIKKDVIDAVQDFLNGNPYPKFFTSTNIVLIPKKENPSFWNDFRPISLCTFFNKLVAKIISSRLSLILPKIISLNQTGFVKGRSIFDNILLAQEMVYDINAKITGGNILFKLDITKAYDNLNWEFLYKTLSMFGFNQNFLLLINNRFENYFFLPSLMAPIMVSLALITVLGKGIHFLLLFLSFLWNISLEGLRDCSAYNQSSFFIRLVVSL
ncbi:integrator complex subunit 11 [Dendrobium catenatum]|uniref:Integrator complex subunit 11 n=1 Tax=Dendrobium catenatum TaxID=906689 RepID=A0A2I0VCN2_9ASPA|nr:integrator complex subunit 11 [Dendrobium catenatum]